MLQKGDVTSKTVSFSIKGFVHDLYFTGHKKINRQINIKVYKIKTENGLPVFDGNKIPIPDPSVPEQETTSGDDGSYAITFDGTPTGVYCIKGTDDKPNPKYDSKNYFINISDISEGKKYNQDIILADTKKRQKIEDDPQKVSIREIFMLE